MFIYIKTLSEKKITIDVQPSNTIIDIKEKIKEKENIHPVRQKLLFKGVELIDNKTLVDYDIKNESTLQLMIKSPILFFVKTKINQTVMIKAQLSDTILFIKQEIQKKEDSLEQFSLVFKGKELDDNKIVADYNIPNNSTLELALRTAIKIKIKLFNGKTINLQAYSSENIFNIKQKIIEEEKNISSDEGELFFGNIQLEENKTLSDYDIKNESTLELKQNMMIYVKGLKDKNIVLKVQPCETINNIKQKIKDKENISPDKFKIAFNDKELNDNKTLKDYNIQKGSILKLILKEPKPLPVKTLNEQKKPAINLNNDNYENKNQINHLINDLKNEQIKKDEKHFNLGVKYEEEEEKNEQKEDEEDKEINNKKCSLDEHKEIDAIFYCQECKINMCNKCEKIHSELLKNHHIDSLDKDVKDIFTGLCTIPKHSMILEYYCETHNQLCCAACTSKIQKNGNGYHGGCKIYYITEIKDQKKENFKKNKKNLEDLSSEFEPLIKELKNSYEKINERKDKLKKEIQNIFTKIRTELKSREDKLYEEIDKKFNELYFKEDLIKESEKFPNLIKISLEKANFKNNELNDINKLSKMINEGIKLENMISKINDFHVKIKSFKAKKDIDINFSLKNDEIEKGLIDIIKKFGDIKVVNKNDINPY